MDQKILIAIIVGVILLIIIGFVFMKKKDNYEEASPESIFAAISQYMTPTKAPTPEPTPEPRIINFFGIKYLEYPDGSVWQVLPNGNKGLVTPAPTPDPNAVPRVIDSFFGFEPDEHSMCC